MNEETLLSGEVKRSAAKSPGLGDLSFYLCVAGGF